MFDNEGWVEMRGRRSKGDCSEGNGGVGCRQGNEREAAGLAEGLESVGRMAERMLRALE